MKRRAIMLVIKGCSACQEFKPRFEEVMKQAEYEYQILDVMESKQGAAWCKTFEVNCFPTTLIFGKDEAQIVEGNVSEKTLKDKLVGQ